jgi:hypothetical protein
VNVDGCRRKRKRRVVQALQEPVFLETRTDMQQTARAGPIRMLALC